MVKLWAVKEKTRKIKKKKNTNKDQREQNAQERKRRKQTGRNYISRFIQRQSVKGITRVKKSVYCPRLIYFFSTCLAPERRKIRSSHNTTQQSRLNKSKDTLTVIANSWGYINW